MGIRMVLSYRLGIGIVANVRQAYDLGLNCDSSKWKIHDRDLFSPEESQTRRQIWWACVLADRYGRLSLSCSSQTLTDSK